MTRSLRGSFALPLLLSLGCSSGTGSTPPGGGGSVGGSGHTGSTSSQGGGFHFVSGGTTSTSTGPVDIDAACVATGEPAKLTQVNIVILLDKSGSMGDQINSGTGDYDWQNCESRWNPVSKTLKEFFSDTNSGRLYASLSFLPADGDEYTMCTASKYASGSSAIKVSLSALDDTGRQKFLDKLCDCGEGVTMASSCIKPSGGTPTLPALQGTLDYAASLRTKYPESKTVVVLLTDGEPGFGFNYNGTVRHIVSCDDLPPKGCTGTACGCAEDDSCYSDDKAAAEVEAIKLVIANAPENSVYVAGVGDISEETLEAWATASGNAAINLLDMTGEEAAMTLRARLEAIRESSISCDFDIPVPSDGSSVDADKTNVNYKNGSQVTTTLYRSKDGTAGTCGNATNAWYFDNPNAPKKISLCAKTCEALQSDPKGEIQVAFGCKTVVQIN